MKELFLVRLRRLVHRIYGLIRHILRPNLGDNFYVYPLLFSMFLYVRRFRATIIVILRQCPFGIKCQLCVCNENVYSTATR